MTKQEAIIKMKQGEKLTHTHFTPDEFITMKDGKIIDENEYELDFNEFWKYRTHIEWEDGWLIFD